MTRKLLAVHIVTLFLSDSIESIICLVTLLEDEINVIYGYDSIPIL